LNKKVVVLGKLEQGNTNATATEDMTAWAVIPPVSLAKTIGKTILFFC
jgi:hypothetical protein